MAKKKAAPAAATAKSKSKPKAAGKSVPSGKSPGKKAPASVCDHGLDHDHSECMEIELDEVEAKAVDMADHSQGFRSGLEQAVNKSLFQAVRKFYREHGTSLSVAQAQNVAIALFFGD